MINAKTRFALIRDGELYDYATSTHIAAHGFLLDGFGRWDLALVAECISKQQTIERAFTPLDALNHQETAEAAFAARDKDIARLNDELSAAKQSLEAALAGLQPKSGTSASRAHGGTAASQALLEATNLEEPRETQKIGAGDVGSLDELLAPQEASPPAKPEG